MIEAAHLTRYTEHQGDSCAGYKTFNVVCRGSAEPPFHAQSMIGTTSRTNGHRTEEGPFELEDEVAIHFSDNKCRKSDRRRAVNITSLLQRPLITDARPMPEVECQDNFLHWVSR